MKNSKDLQEFIKLHSIDAELIEGEDFSTSVSAAQSLNLTPDRILKSIILICDNIPVIVFLRGSKRISLAKIKKLGFKHVRLANDKEILEIVNYKRGAVPPLDLPSNLIKILDKDIANEYIMYAGGGDLNKTLKIRISDIIKINSPKIADISQ
ncbi:MAG: YbaK/EbsC family protein [Candidatus Parvarchaeota archaeon]|nr:YbaK/EbsC family protein [Candidatus Rehaiarchaeum fermentans]MCW1293427.1 YbaK/EbsC family protein [Candidatus Rehaiarchaeum fermentans]